MTIRLLIRKNYLLGTVLVLVSAFSATAPARGETPPAPSSEEQTLREQIRRESEGGGRSEFTDDAIFVSGRYPHPLIGRQQREDAHASAETAEPMSNYRTTSEIVRLVVADSGDLAYEFSNGTLSFDDTQQKHVSIQTSLLRVWRKVDGKWKVAVFFARPDRIP